MFKLYLLQSVKVKVEKNILTYFKLIWQGKAMYGCNKNTLTSLACFILPALLEPLMFAKPGDRGETQVAAIENEFYCYNLSHY